jgi:hypothetical protein
MQREKSPANHLLTQIPSPVSEKDKKKNFLLNFTPKICVLMKFMIKTQGFHRLFKNL